MDRSAAAPAAPYRDGQQQRFVCPDEGSPLSEINSLHDGPRLTQRTYACESGHVWRDEIGGDGIRTWSPVPASIGRLF